MFPVEPLGKTPGRLYPHRPADEAPWTIKWSEVATTHIPTIVQWWNNEPNFNIGIACAPSGLLVVDCDLKMGDGLQEWADICQRTMGDNSWMMWDTYTVNTGGGGAHFYYGWPAWRQASQSGISKNVDIRSNGGNKGGYVLAEGSITTKGSYEPDNSVAVQDAPEWLQDLCVETPRPAPIKSRYERAAPTSYAGLVQSVCMAPDGNRNQALLWATRAMTHDGARESEILDLLVPAAVDNGLTEREATDTIRSGHHLQLQKDGR